MQVRKLLVGRDRRARRPLFRYLSFGAGLKPRRFADRRSFESLLKFQDDLATAPQQNRFGLRIIVAPHPARRFQPARMRQPQPDLRRLPGRFMKFHHGADTAGGQGRRI